jgi:two-component system chemotaxis sensor kinase CheA
VPIDGLVAELAAILTTRTGGDLRAPADGEPGASASEARVPEARAPEARAPEARAPEVGAPEEEVAEAEVPRAEVPRAEVPEAEVPRAEVIKAGLPLAGGAKAEVVKAGAPDRDMGEAVQQARRPAVERRTLRVPAEKIDHLLDVVGEVMQYQRRLSHSLGTQTRQSQDVADVFSVGDRMLDELKDTAAGLRTLPLSAITGSLPRAVRDFARVAGKSVEFVVTGPDTELDRVILESLSEPLGHLLRNAVNHGIESPAQREHAGKPPRGRIEVRALPRGSVVEIVVADDGGGVSAEVMALARHEGSLTDILSRPGYSTAEQLTDLAGRGVGLDAVRAYAQSMGGSLEVRSEPGRGTEIILLLPLALALLQVLLFERGGAVYGVPLAAVQEVLTVTGTLTLEDRPALEVRGRSLPVMDFAALVGAKAPPLGASPPALLISVGGRRAIASCDSLLGQEEVVVKSLGPLFGGVTGYLGASILGDGRIALLIEPEMLTRGSWRADGPAAQLAAEPPAAPKILVVEDSFTVRELQRNILEAAGYPVVTARDGREALGVLERDAEIALVMSDLEMPELDGLGLTRAIRADPARASLPVIIVTSLGSEDDQRRGIEAGADAYMVKKSFDQQALLATVERLVGR